ncbi:MAG: hypothetical protein HZB30_06105 [Nitrospirae bacterium]|nr:hypothetical protein [Nitrospirota bacterium]
MLTDYYLFEVPIYSCTINEHKEKMKMLKKQFLKCLEGNTESYEKFSNYFDRERWFPWQYNETIGWIEIFICGSQVRGEYWFVKERISKKLKKKHFQNKGKLFEYSPSDDSASSGKIFQELLDTIKSVIKESHVKKYYVDFSKFENTGKLLNWSMLLNS